ncbi:hypothetical protein [Frondihabitans australicus]|uniref:Uncharacterized protein n=1 Tax=Frondihabitans australicus TaxID=386892 RepID=A0A495IH33_9MICO|nr:hypothetical protein [Frondihabitans australicus]RKR75264.1 hypothetical protein C8E83_2403 [Frondihabitans australicus]
MGGDDEAPDGFERLGFAPDPAPEAPATQPKPPWWVSGRSLVASAIIGGVWWAVFVVRLIALLTGAQTNGLDITLLVASGLLGLAYVPSVVYFTRRRRA